MKVYDKLLGELDLNEPGVEARYCQHCHTPLLDINEMEDTGYCMDCAEEILANYCEETFPFEGEKIEVEGVPFEENDPINPNHYKQGSIELIDFMEETSSKEEFQGYCKNNVLKYVVRYKQKNGVEDLKKAQWYLERLIRSENEQD